MKRDTGIVAPAVRAYAGAPAGIAAIVAVAGLALPAQGQNMQWAGAVSQAWANPANWAPWGLPSDLTNVFIGPHPGIENGRVDLSSSLTIASLFINDGMVLDTDWHRLTVEGDTVLTGSNLVELSEHASMLHKSGLDLGAADGSSLTTQNLTMSDGAGLRMKSSFVRINDLMSIGDGTGVYGSGVIDMWDSGTTFRNDGLIQVMDSNGIHLRQFGGGLYDLDGVTGAGYIHMGSYDGDTDQGFRFRMDGTALTDSFSGQMVLGPDSDFFANLSEGWTIDANARVWAAGLSGISSEPAVIRGGDLELAGEVEVVGIGHLSLRSEKTTILDAARFTINPESRATIGSGTGTEVIVEGGTFTLGEGAMMRFEGETTMRGGEFTTFSDDVADGTVTMAGQTDWDGTVTFHGSARQLGDARVMSPTVIHADTFAMTASTGTEWVISNTLVINAARLGAYNNIVDGSIRIGGGFIGGLTVNIETDGYAWTMAGDLELIGDGVLFPTRIGGDLVSLSGDVLVSGRSQITADTVIQSSSTTTFSHGNAGLRFRGSTLIGSGASFVGDGTIINGIGGEMLLFDGASLGSVGLVNTGELRIGAGSGMASVDRFEQSDDGSWIVDIIGTEAGVLQDLLIVSSGGADLDGTLLVSVLGTDSAANLPQVGDEFTVLIALGGVSGVFAAVPPSYYPGGIELHWSAIYHPHSVVVRLESIVPTPGALTLAGLAGLALVRRIRR